MKLKSTIVAALLLAAPNFAQTVTELLQKGIYAQETSGNLDEAVLIYRQIVNSASGQRDIAAQAQYRLADTLIRKGDLTNAATEFQKLARDYPDQQTLIGRIASSLPAQPGVGGRGLRPLIEAELIGGSIAETQKFLESQLDLSKKRLESMSQNPQSTSTEEQRAEVQAKMSAIKAQIADLQAKIEATRITSDLEQGRTTRQGKSK